MDQLNKGNYGAIIYIIFFLGPLYGLDTGTTTKNPLTTPTAVLQPPFVNVTSLAGINVERVFETPFYYDTLMPIIFEIDVPALNLTGDQLQVEYPKNISSELIFCVNSTSDTDLNGTLSREACPIKDILNSLLHLFAEEIKSFGLLSGNTSNTTVKAKFASCNEIKPHFSNHIMTRQELIAYAMQALNCPNNATFYWKVKGPNVNKTKYSELFAKFVQTHITPKYHMGSYTKAAVGTNTLLSLHTIQLIDFMLDAFRWSSSVATCNAQRIPSLLIDELQFEAGLTEVLDAAKIKGLNLTIPYEDIATYYKLPIADCVMTNKKTYVIRVLVPLTNFNSDYKLMSVTAIPFLNHEYEHSHSDNEAETMVCIYKNVEAKIVVSGKEMTPVAHVTCEDGQLCSVPQPGDRPIFGKCVMASLKNDVQEVSRQCIPKCIRYEESLLPYIKRVRSDQFVIIGTSSADFAVICPELSTKERLVKPQQNVGGTLVTLPCSCYLSHRSDKFYVEGACMATLNIQSIRPKGWQDMVENYNQKSQEESKNKNTDDSMQTPDDNTVDSNANVDNQPHSHNSGWGIGIAYFLIFVELGCVIVCIFILRNLYQRLGQLEVSTAKNSCRKRQCQANEFSSTVMSYTQGDAAVDAVF